MKENTESTNMNLRVTYIKPTVQNDYYTGFFTDFPNIITDGDSKNKLFTNLKNMLYDIIKHTTNNKQK